MKQTIITILLVLVAMAAQAQGATNVNSPDSKERCIFGAWVMVSETAPDGKETKSIYTQYTRCKI